MRRSARAAWVLLALAPAVRVARAEEEAPALKRVREDLPRLRKDLAALRALDFERDVLVHGQSEAAFRAFVAGRFDEAFPPSKAGPSARAQARLGLLPEGYDLRREMLETIVGQAAAYYHRGAFYVVKPEAFDDKSSTHLVVHELHHALQDQRFELQKKLDVAEKGDEDDAALALKFLAEGEAEYVATLHTMQAQGLTEEDASKGVEDMAALSRRTLVEMLRRQVEAQGEKGKARLRELEQLEKLPLWIYRSLVEPYVGGASMVAKVRRDGGWKAVDALWRDPPRSTSQALRPEKRLIGAARLDPTRIELPDCGAALGDGWKMTVTTVVGELGLETLLEEKLPDDRRAVARGWLGDRCHAYEDERSSPALVWFLTATTPEAAKKLADAYVEILAKKYPGARATTSAEGGRRLEEAGVAHAVEVRGADVAIVEHAPAASIGRVVARALEATKAPPK